MIKKTLRGLYDFIWGDMELLSDEDVSNAIRELYARQKTSQVRNKHTFARLFSNGTPHTLPRGTYVMPVSTGMQAVRRD